jgi:hypothetical protein
MTNEEFEPIRIRIMQEAYDLADRNDTEGYNSVKVMCGDVQNLLRREWVGLTDEDIKDIMGRSDSDGIGAYTRKLFKQIEDKLREKNT